MGRINIPTELKIVYVGTPCTRCGGSGRISTYAHVQHGDCFRCDTTGIDPVNRKAVRTIVARPETSGERAARAAVVLPSLEDLDLDELMDSAQEAPGVLVSTGNIIDLDTVDLDLLLG